METNTTVLQNDQRTILVVDDNPEILRFVADFLVDSSYRVLTSSSGMEAMKQSKEYKGDIDLLLTDFQMPGLSGIDLATLMSAQRSKIKVLMMSGFTGGMLILNEGWHFLAKPFIPSQLLALIVGLVSPDRSSKFVPDNLD